MESAKQQVCPKVDLKSSNLNEFPQFPALKFAKLGASLSLTGRKVENLEKVAAECEKISEKKPFIVAGDITNEADTKKILEETVKHYNGNLNVLVNNAGIIETGTIENTSLEQFDRVMNTNIRSIYHLTMLAVPYLIKSQGCVVNVSSVNGIRSFPGVLAYNISKASVDQFTRYVVLNFLPRL